MSKKNRNNSAESMVSLEQAGIGIVEALEASGLEVSTEVPSGDYIAEGFENLDQIMDDSVAPVVKEKGKKAKKALDVNDPFMKQSIELVRKENPKRKGSKSANRYELYRTCSTVAEFLAAGGTRGDINWDNKHEHIRLVPTQRAAAE